MDYDDDNDFQSQNFQLIGEDNNKFPSSLRSFGLPKFDLDEHLEVHLRFDSLVDTDSLLGMHGQENNWIEEFSAGNTIEFSSSAAESCSISRHNNVWSEATSSESVEMLLKSVGEDEMLDKKTTKETGTLQELGGSDNPIDPCSIQGGSFNVGKGDIVMIDPALPPDKAFSIDEMAGQPETVGISQFSNTKNSEVELDVDSLVDKFNSDAEAVAAQCTADETLALLPSSSDGVDKNFLETKDSLCMTVQSNEHSDSVFMEVSDRDDHDFVANDVARDSPVSVTCGTEGHPPAVSISDCEMGAGKLSNQMSPGQVTEEQTAIALSSKLEVLVPDDALKEKGQINSGDEVNVQCSEGHEANNDPSIENNSSYLDVEMNPPSEECNNSAYSEKQDGLLESIPYQVKVMGKSGETDDEIAKQTKELSSLGVKCDGKFERLSSEISNEDTANLSHSAEGFKDAGHGDMEHLPKADDSQILNTFPNTLVEEISEKQDPENQSIENTCNNLDSASKPATELHSSVHVIPETPVTKIKDADSPGNHESNFTSQNSESACLDKSEAVVNVTEVVILEKSPSMSILHNEVGRPCDDHVIAVGDSIVGNENTGPAGSGAAHSNDDKFITMERIEDVSSAGHDAAAETAVDGSSGKLFEAESEQKDGVLPLSTSDSVHSEEKGVKFSGFSCSSSSKSIPDAQNSITGPAESAELTSQKSANVNQLHSESTIVADMGVQREEPTLHLPAHDIIHTNEGDVRTSEIISPPILADTQNCSTKKFLHPSGLSENNATNHSMKAERSNPGSCQPNSSSPTVIACTEHPQDAMESRDDCRELLDKTGYASNELTANVGTMESTAHESKDGAASVNDKSGAFEVGSLAGRKLKPSSKINSRDTVQVSSMKSQGGCVENEEAKPHDTTAKKTEEKTTSCSSTGRGNASKRKSAKETILQKQTSGRDGNISNKSPISAGTISRDAQLEHMRPYPCETASKASYSPAVQASGLPDLNTSISTSSLFHQPFSDLQQVQLRAQIFVYGSLIQGTPPDEACMISAFGGADGGRNLWDAAWHAAVERFQNQKSPLSTCETPVNLRSGISSLQSKALSPPASWSGTKVVSATSSSTVPLPSPLWSVSARDGLQSNIPRGTHLDFSQVLSPLYSYQSSQVRQYMDSGVPQISHTSHPGSSVTPVQPSKLDASARYPTIPITETVHATPARDSSVLRSPSMQLVSPSVILPASGHSIVSASSIVPIEAPKKTTHPENSKKASTAPKSRKKKKVTVPEDPGPILPVSRAQADPASVTGIVQHLPSSTSLPLPVNSPAKVTSGGLASAIPNIVFPAPYQVISSSTFEQRALFSEETGSRIVQAKLQAEDAASLAASAVRHSQGIWSQLATQKNSGLVSEVEEKLASAAVAAASAASVAKAAAAAAKVASDAALQAKMMADEALNTVRTGNSSNSSDATLVRMGKNMPALTTVSILECKDKGHGSSSILSVAREAARRRVEAASVATKRAENLDAIVKAAELAAEAVSQAGIIITMGDPLPFTLNELVEHGPEGYWKLHHSATEKRSKTINQLGEGHLGNKDCDISAKQFKEQPPNNKELQRTGDEDGTKELSVQSEDNYEGNESGHAPSTTSNVRRDGDHLASNFDGSIIQKGSLVEVVSDRDGLRGGWFSACVLDMKDGKAYVCYNDLRDEGSGQLKEWILLDAEGSEAPRMRIAHPLTAAKSGGTRKRRRNTVSDHTWEVGDRVDAWIRDGWREGIVSEKNKQDETKLTVHFPARGDSSIVRAWNLRSSLIWKDHQWIEWSRPRGNSLHEGDTPQEKRQRVGRSDTNIASEVDDRGIGKLSKNLHTEASRKPEESRPLPLVAKDRIFTVGKSGREENNIDSLKVKRTGLQKEGSRVVFGVPKPGKKRKFMEVSKHYVAEKTDKSSEGNDSIKFQKYLMPQTSRIWRNTSKVDPKGKGAGDSKPKGLKSVKSQDIQARSTADKDNLSITALSTLNGGGSGHGPLSSTRAFNNEENASEKIDLLQTGSFPDSLGTADNPVVESSVQPVHVFPSSKKKSSVAVEGEIGVTGKHTRSVEKSTGIDKKGSENPGKTIPEALEPRRSNRRIQPTSRLLEGLQSSLLISKIPSVSHDKGAKSLHRGGSSARGRGF